MRRRESLIGQIVAVNVLLVTATLFGASAAAGLDLTVDDDRARFGLLAMSIILVLLVNMLLLRRRFSPLEALIERVERIDPAQPAEFDTPPSTIEEVERLSTSFRRLLRRIDEERRRGGRMVLRAQEDERRRLARDLHDEVNQALTAILLRLEALSQDAEPELRTQLDELKALVSQAMDELLRLARQLRPAALDDLGLVAAIEGQLTRFSEQTGIQTSLRTQGEPGSVGEDQQTVIYRVVQEALNNAAQHSGASHIDFDLQIFPSHGVELRVSDDGRGFDTRRATSGLGLGGMAERARLVGGELAIRSEPGHGTRVRLYIPQ